MNRRACASRHLPRGGAPCSRARVHEEDFDEVPPADERAWIVDELAALVGAAGAKRFLEGPIVLPTEAFFPDPWLVERSRFAAAASLR